MSGMLRTVDPDAVIAQLSPKQKTELLDLLEARERAEGQRLFERVYTDNGWAWSGPSILGGLVKPGQYLHARELYPRHMEFFRVGATHRERCFMAANRVGKTFGGGGYEVSAHLTGLYPEWWEGRRFDHAISAVAAGDTYETTRDIIQITLLGEVTYEGARKVMDGRGIVPGHLISAPTWRSGVANLVDTIKVKHVSGEWSSLRLKSYDQGRKAFQGTGQHVIWLDEEPPADVYGECLIRTATLGGIVMLTFTPLSGLSEVVLSFMPEEWQPDKE